MHERPATGVPPRAIVAALLIASCAALLTHAPLAANVFAANGLDPRGWVEPGSPDARLLRPVGAVTADFALRDLRGIGGVAPGEGTAFMVSPCYAMTSYHVLFGARPLTLDPMAAYRVTIRFGGNGAGGGGLLAKGRARFWGSAGGSTPDIALILLDRCPGRQLGWFDLVATGDAQAPDEPVAMPSFSHDRSMRRLSVQHGCRVHAAVPGAGCSTIAHRAKARRVPPWW